MMKRCAALGLVMVGCGAPAEPLKTPKPIAHAADRELPALLGAPTPHTDVDRSGMLPTPPFDPSPWGRWPLTVSQHPELEPHFPIANELAQPGVSWLDLCARGAQSRHMATHAELGEYLAAWCAVTKDDYADALQQLAPLRNERRLHDAVELDVSSIVAAGISGDSAESTLRHANLIDIHIIDLTSAAYFEVGKLDAALAMNRLVADVDRRPTEEVYCHRLAREYANSGPTEQAAIYEQLDHKQATGSMRCDGMLTVLRPEHVLPVPTDTQLFVDSWPKQAARFEHWQYIVKIGEKLQEQYVGYRLAVAALEMALRTSQCELGQLGWVRDYAMHMQQIDNPWFGSSTPSHDTVNRRIPLHDELRVFEAPLQELEQTARTFGTEPRDSCVIDLQTRLAAAPTW
ncbi:MAG: hypothetical protein QM831_38070 [Kofleriaceae bacterium]